MVESIIQTFAQVIHLKMTEQLNKTGKDLNATFIPASLLRKTENKLASSLASKYDFQKTTGNAFIIIEPPEIKFSGYQLDKSYTAIVKVINKAPIPQRINILPPEESAFALKTNKKGSIASGMAETITVIFKSSEFKYQHDVIRITTQTQNFVIPLYAYPTLPDLRSIFPKMIDFGAVQIKQPATYFYPIKNVVPLNFQFQFSYQKECQQIIITPLSGVIPAQQTVTIQITFMPKQKCTYYSQATLSIQQFDFQPLPITIMGTGMQKPPASLPKRIKSSKLAPIKEGDQPKKANIAIRRRPSGQGNINAISNNNFNATGTINLNATGNLPNISMNNGINATPGATLRKTNIRTSYPKLMIAKRTLGQQDMNKTMNPAKVAEREYINRFDRILELDKEKQIKFACFLGDRAMNEHEIEFEQQVVRQMNKARNKALENRCVTRYNPELLSEVEVELKILTPKQLTWDDKKNDQHHNRRQALFKFMDAGSRVILKYRLLKRLGKIRQFLGGCKNKQEVRKKIEQSHSKAMDQQQGISFTEELLLNFNTDSLHPTFFSLQLEQNNQSAKNVTFKPVGKTSFDDLAQIKQLAPHRLDQLKLAESVFPPDYYNHHRTIPKTRSSGQEQWALKSSTISGYNFQPLTSIYSLPLKVPAHHFIYDNHSIRRYKNYASKDEKDPQEYLQDDSAVQDQFQGWTGGQFQILKAKFSRNLGCEYTTFSSYNYSSDKYQLPALATLGQNLPLTIEQVCFQDTIQEGDSDEQKIAGTPVESAIKYLQQIQINPDLKERRSKNIIKNPEKELRQTIQKTLQTAKERALGEAIGRIKQVNQWAESTQNRILM